MKRLLLLSMLLCLMACQPQEQRAKTFVTQLGAADAAHRAEAMEALIAMGSSAIDALILGLSNENPQIREMSVWTLSEIETPAERIVPAIISSLTDPDETIRVVGSVALQSLGEPAVPYLIDALSAPAAEIRLNAAYALGEIGTSLDTVIPALIDTLTDPEWNVRRLVVRALVRIGTPAVDSLIQALNSPDQDLRRMAERALNDIGTPQTRRAIADAKRRLIDR
jgi:HEAT repeat protein